MDIEQLNKSQIILLTLLVSFITSIATGIVTVTLMDQAPEGVSRTITHVVERTVDQVTPGTSQTATIIKEVPVVVTEEELVLKAINLASPGVVTLQSVSRTTIRQTKDVSNIGTAYLATADGRFVTAGSFVQRDDTYQVEFEDGSVYPVEVLYESEDDQIAVLRVLLDARAAFLKEGKKTLVWANGNVSVGQSVIGIGSDGKSGHTVAMGIISSFPDGPNGRMTTNAASMATIGGPLVDIRGGVVGVNMTAGTALGKSIIEAAIDSAV